MEGMLGLAELPLTLDDLLPEGSTSRQASQRRSAPHHSATSGDQDVQLNLLDEEQVKECQKCGLAASRSNTVFGQGSANARLVFVGEAPGYHEDQQGLAFVGKAGELLTSMIKAMTLTREEVYICNILKCRPPQNRDPAPDEVAACNPYLRKQLAIIKPEVIVALGAPAARTLLDSKESIGRLRGQFHDFYVEGPLSGPPVPLMPTYHPAYLLRSPADKHKTWADLQQVMQLLGLTRG